MLTFGAQRQSVGTAELSAEFWAGVALYSGQLDIPTNVDVWVTYDSQYAAGVTMGTTMPRTNQRIATNAQSIWRLCTLRHTTTWGHAFSHQNEPINEFADSLAESAAQNVTARTNQVLPTNIFGQYSISTIQLLYLLDIPAQVQDAYPDVTNGNTIQGRDKMLQM